MSKLYNVAKITITEHDPKIKWIYFTCRDDDRTPEQIIADGNNGFRNGSNAKIYHALVDSDDVVVETVFRGLNKTEAKSKYKTLIQYERALGENVLNELYKK